MACSDTIRCESDPTDIALSQIWVSGGREFESPHPDHIYPVIRSSGRRSSEDSDVTAPVRRAEADLSLVRVLALKHASVDPLGTSRLNVSSTGSLTATQIAGGDERANVVVW